MCLDARIPPLRDRRPALGGNSQRRPNVGSRYQTPQLGTVRAELWVAGFLSPMNSRLSFAAYLFSFSALALLVGCTLEGPSAETHARPDAKLSSQEAAQEGAASLSEATPSSLGVGGHVEGFDLDCHLEEQPSGGTCEPQDESSACQACVASECCAEQAACNSLAPMNACAFGSTLFGGRSIEGGEIACLMECLTERSSREVLAGDPSDIEACSTVCAASECGSEQASSVSEELATCILGDARIGNPGCSAECGLLL